MSTGPGRTGRPTVRTPDMIETIKRALENGMGYKWAAKLVGISERTLRDWRRDDHELSAALSIADADGAKSAWFCITNSARNGDWKAAAFMIEHKYSSHAEVDEEEMQDRAQKMHQLGNLMRGAVPDEGSAA